MREALDQQAEREDDDDQADQRPVAARGTGLAARGARARYRLGPVTGRMSGIVSAGRSMPGKGRKGR